MADHIERSGGDNKALYFIVGGLVVIAGLAIFLYTSGYFGGGDVTVNVEAPAASAPVPADEPAAPATPAPAPAN